MSKTKTVQTTTVSSEAVFDILKKHLGINGECEVILERKWREGGDFRDDNSYYVLQAIEIKQEVEI